MTTPVADSDVLALVDRIAEALVCGESSQGCQELVVSLAAQARLA
jgi:hypothetical protein